MPSSAKILIPYHTTRVYKIINTTLFLDSLYEEVTHNYIVYYFSSMIT